MDYRMTYADYQAELEKGEFLGVKCSACGAVSFPPSGVCGNCRKSDMERVPISEGGVVRTYTVIRVAPEGMKPPYIVAIVELDDGPWVLGNLVDQDPETVDTELIGKRVRLGSRRVEGDLYSGGDSWVLTFHLV